MSQFNNKSQLIVRKPFVFNGKSYKHGMVFKTDAVSLRKIRNLYNSRYIMNLHEFEGEILQEEEKEEAKKADEVKKKEESKKKEDKKKKTRNLQKIPNTSLNQRNT